ncbi:MAG TPA: cupin domain-containing protein [Acidimicrobiales bacterium]
MIDITVVHVDDIEPVEVAPGILRRPLPETAGARGWVIDFAPGTEWPAVDHHEGEERYFVLGGEVIEGDVRHGAGTYVVFGAGTSHRPRTEVGARLLGINLRPR